MKEIPLEGNFFNPIAIPKFLKEDDMQFRIKLTTSKGMDSSCK